MAENVTEKPPIANNFTARIANDFTVERPLVDVRCSKLNRVPVLCEKFGFDSLLNQTATPRAA